jgi:hypothetical protein
LTFGGPGPFVDYIDALCGLDYIEQVFDHEGEATWISHYVGLPSHNGVSHQISVFE